MREDASLKDLEGIKTYLTENGELWIVMRKDQGALSMMKDFRNIYDFEIIKKSKGFLVICTKVLKEEI